jgi:acyl transferase domain-containing protein/acyl carrier protein
MTVNPHDELLDRARRVIQDLREKLKAAESRNHSEHIAVIGMGFQFPGCGSDPEQLWQMVAEGRDAVQDVPPDRWDGNAFYSPEAAKAGKVNTRRGAFLDEVRRFDAAFFDITPREAVRMDPQQRIFLETAWHALEDAGVPKSQISGTDVGIFVGVHSHSADYREIQFADLSTLDPYAPAGTAHDMIAGRLAYWLDVHGPAMVVNTACSSSLTAVHLACRSLRAADCNMAIVGGVNLMLTPGSTAAAAQLELLAPDGRCKPFDARADGMGRGEGCGVVVLKKLSSALRDRDRVLAIIRGSAVNQDGKTNGLTAPNGLAQQRVLRRALQDAGIEPWEIGYVEAHGTGTALGDPIEFEALAEVLGGVQRTSPCTLGAVKANLGHLEGAAGIAGLIKAVLVLRHRWLPPVANLEELNPHLALDGTSLSIPQHGSEWKTAGRRLAGVSSFGWSGTNAHVVLEEASASGNKAETPGVWRVVVSAQSQEALHILALAYADRLDHTEMAELPDISYTCTVRKTHHSFRITAQGRDPKEIASQLRERAGTAENAEAAKSTTDYRSETNRAKTLDELIRAWEAGAEVDWETAFSAPGNVVSLPHYPFQGRRYWFESAASPAIAKVSDSFPDNWIYTTCWADRPLKSIFDAPRATPMTWLLFHTDGEFGEALATVIRDRGDRAINVTRGEHFSHTSADVVMLGRDISDGLRKLVAGLVRAGIAPQRAVFLAGDRSASELAAEVLEVTQALLRSGIPIKLWFVTRAVAPEENLLNPHRSHAALRGFSRVFGIEHPEISGGLIEVDVAARANAEAVYDEIVTDAGEDRVQLQSGRRHVARLRHGCVESNERTRNLKPDRSYLVTGAFGRLGIEIASWLVESGARHLVLVGRRDPSQSDNPALLQQIEAWRARGIRVIAQTCDVADEVQVRKLIASSEEGGKLLGGVIHAAAGVSFNPILEATRRDVDFAMRAKADGARVLDRCTRVCPLEFFVLFGSAAATIGLRNGALYAAANSAMEEVVAERRALQRPVLLVEWGAWSHGEAGKQQELVENSGFIPMRPERALRALGALIDSGQSTALIADIDWTTLGPALEMRGRSALVSEMIGEIQPAHQEKVQAEAASLNNLSTLATDARRERLLGIVGCEVRAVFGMSPEDYLDENRGFFQLGMDSLMSVRLKRRLEVATGLRLPSTLTLNYPTVTSLAQYLEEKIFPSAPGQSVTTSLPAGNHDGFTSAVEGMNEFETNAAIAAELAAIQQKLGVL